MSPKNHLVLKAGIKNFFNFLFIWFCILIEAWYESEEELKIKGLVISFLILQAVGLFLTYLVKSKLDKNPIQ